MFVFSVKSTKTKIVILLALIIIAVVTIAAVLSNSTPVSGSQAAVKYLAANAEERRTFLTQYGWEVTDDPIEVAEVLIPAEFDEVYNEYNEIQMAQGLDLLEYAGTRAKRWTYGVNNYPGYENSDVIRANVLVYDGRVIGGDICSIELNGFMHGFKMP